VAALGDEARALARLGVKFAASAADAGSLGSGGRGAENDAVLDVVASILDVGGDEASLGVGFVAAEVAPVAGAKVDVGCTGAVVGDAGFLGKWA